MIVSKVEKKGKKKTYRGSRHIYVSSPTCAVVTAIFVVNTAIVLAVNSPVIAAAFFKLLSIRWWLTNLTSRSRKA